MITSANPSPVLQALLKAQGDFPAIPKRGYNPHFKSRFATFEDTKGACDPILTGHGLGVVQLPSQLDGKPALTTLLVNGDAEFFGDITPLSLTKQDPQAHGSALTYMKRYCYSAILGLLTDEEDDDGNVGAGRESNPQGGAVKAEKPATLADVKSASDRAGASKDTVERYFKGNFKVSMTDANQTQINSAVNHFTKMAVELELAAK